MRRVVVTGLGMVTPIGVGVPVVWEKIISGQSGIRALTGPEFIKLPCRVAGTVPQEKSQGCCLLNNYYYIFIKYFFI